MNIHLTGVIGAGVMGADVAFDLSLNGYHVILNDLSEETLKKAEQKITRNVRSYRMLIPALSEVSAETILSRITFTTDLSQLSQASLVIENITESWKEKSALYRQLASFCSKDTYFAVNTSCISITKIAALLPSPDRVMGMHFMNPVPLKKMVEMVRGFHTSEETIAYGKDFLKTLNKRAVVVDDFPGFAANRLSHLFMNEAAFLVQDRVADPKDIDRLFREGYGHQMGPLETADLIGLDTVVNSLEILYESFQDSKFRCCPLLKKMVDAGQLGKKSGQGFYAY